MTGEHTSVIYGKHFPNRLFVGCLPPEAEAVHLGDFFSDYGNVVEAKIVLDRDGRSKRFGFVTFSNSDNVEELIKKRGVIFKGKMINVGPAVKKNLDNEVHPKTETKPKTCVGPQHTPKTVIRRSPTDFEGLENFYDGARHCSRHRDESLFQSLWGISSKPNSVWCKENEKKSSTTSSSTTESNHSSIDDLNDDLSKLSFGSQDGSLDTSLNNLPGGGLWNAPSVNNDSWRYHNQRRAHHDHHHYGHHHYGNHSQHGYHHHGNLTHHAHHDHAHNNLHDHHHHYRRPVRPSFPPPGLFSNWNFLEN